MRSNNFTTVLTYTYSSSGKIIIWRFNQISAFPVFTNRSYNFASEKSSPKCARRFFVTSSFSTAGLNIDLSRKASDSSVRFPLGTNGEDYWNSSAKSMFTGYSTHQVFVSLNVLPGSIYSLVRPCNFIQ